jgi:hypothetical protein
MDSRLLIKFFFDANNVHEFSGTRLLYSLMLNPYIEGLAHRTVRGFLNRRKEEIDNIVKADDVKSLLSQAITEELMQFQCCVFCPVSMIMTNLKNCYGITTIA